MGAQSRDRRWPPLLSGSIAGAAAALFGYALTYLATSGDVRGSTLARVAEFATGDDVTWQLVGWLFYNAHFVQTIVDVDVPLVGGTDATNFIAEGQAFSPALYLIPIALLFGAGLAVARFRASTSSRDAVLTGIAVAAGYLPLAVVGTFLFEIAVNASRAGPDVLPAVVLAGVLYPVTFATLGAYVGHKTA